MPEHGDEFKGAHGAMLRSTQMPSQIGAHMTMRNLGCVFALVFLVAACSLERSPLVVSGDGGPSNQKPAADAGQPALGACPGLELSPSKPLSLPQVKGAAPLSLREIMWNGSGFLTLWSSFSEDGHWVAALDAEGNLGTARPLWHEHPLLQEPHLAATEKALAVAGVLRDANQRPNCHVGFASTVDGATLAAPKRVSDATEAGSIINEVDYCGVTAVGEEFVVIWQQRMSRTSSTSSLFVQRFSSEGQSKSERVLLMNDEHGKPALVTAMQGKDRAAVAYVMGKGDSLITTIHKDKIETVAVEGQEPIRVLGMAQGRFVAASDTGLVVLGADGKRLQGPRSVEGSFWHAAPFGDGFVLVQKEEFLVARSLSADLATSSAPVGLHTDRQATPSHLAYASDGSLTALIFNAGSDGLRFARFTCTESARPVAPGPTPCVEAPNAPPLDDECKDEVCHTIIRLDGITLSVLGHAAVGGPAQSVDATAAKRLAEQVFQGRMLGGGLEVSPARAGVFRVSKSPSDFGGFALIGANGGATIAAGGIVWSGRGGLWFPESWRPAKEIVCGGKALKPAQVHLDASVCLLDDKRLATAEEALERALRTNRAAHVGSKGAFSAYVFLYTPSVGQCDPTVAEYLVVLTRG